MSTIYVELPLYKDLKYRYALALEGQSWQFTFYWNTRCKQWQMDLRMEDQTPLVLGHGIVPQYPMMVDYNLEGYGLSGYFILLPVNSTLSSKITEDSSVVPEFFSLFYVYNVED